MHVFCIRKILKIIFGKKLDIVHSGFGQLHDSESIFRKIYDPLFLKWTFSSFKILLGENKHEIQEYEKLKSNLKIKNTFRFWGTRGGPINFLLDGSEERAWRLLFFNFVTIFLFKIIKTIGSIINNKSIVFSI